MKSVFLVSDFMRAMCKRDVPPLVSGMTPTGFLMLVKRNVASNTKERDLMCG